MHTYYTKQQITNTIQKAVNIIAILTALQLLSHNLAISLSLLHLATIYLLIAVTLLNIPLRYTIQQIKKPNPHRPRLLIGLLILIIAMLLLIRSPSQLLWITSISLFTCGIDLTLTALNKKRKEITLLAASSLIYTIVLLLIQTISPIWFIIQQTSLTITQAIGSITGTPLLLGPSISGLSIILIFMIFLITGYLLSSQKTKTHTTYFLASLTTLLILWMIYLIHIAYATMTKHNATNLQPLLFVFGFIPCIIYLLIYPSKTPNPQQHQMKKTAKKLFKNTAIYATLLLLLFATTSSIVLPQEQQPQDSKKVVFYAEQMLGTWDLPEYGKYGREGVGMFGLWPLYLESLGYDIGMIVENTTLFLNRTQPPLTNITRYVNLTDYATFIETSAITSDILTDTAVLVITNKNSSFTADEHDIIWDYVNNGGSLLVLGDHTNVGGIQQPLNELLAPVHISYRFDSTLPLDQQFKWQTSTRLMHHPVTIPLRSIDELQWGVGASLDITSTSSPLIIGTYALSDTGDQENPDIAYLGDYEYSKDEQLGDIILVAAAYYGKGKVMVFGDTSSFQNTALPSSYQFLQSTFAWLTSTATATTQAPQTSIALLFLTGAVFLIIVGEKRSVYLALFTTSICFALLLATMLNPMMLTTTTPQGNLVFIDASHGQRFSRESFTSTSVSGLILNLQRNNFLPVILQEFSEEKIAAGSLFISIAATASFQAKEVTFLKEYMNNGGYVLLASGFDDKHASLPLLSAFDLDIQHIPLGPVPYGEVNRTLYQNEPRFVDSWPLLLPNEKSTSYYNFTWGETTYHLVAAINQGKGGLLVIADSQFLLDKNIESLYDYWPGNIMFLKHLIDETFTLEE